MFGLSFLAPAFLVGAAAAAVPIVLHLFKRHVQPEVRFSAVRFLRRAPVEQSRRRRLRELLLLALRVSALLLLAFSFARPFFDRVGAFTDGPVTIVAVDTSFSMSAPGQFERARQLARAAVNSAPAGHRVGLVAFDDAARLVVRADAARGTALAAIDGLRPGFGGTRYAPALARAGEACGPGAGRIVVVTDLQQVGWEAEVTGAVPERVQVEVADAGHPASNLAVIDLRRDRGALIAAIRNTGAAARTARARLTLDGRAVGEEAFTAAAGLVAEVRFAQTLPPSGVVSVSIDDRDGYGGDNTRYLVLDAPEPAPVLVISNNGSVTRDAFYLDRALSIGEGASFHVSVTNGEDLASEEQLTRYAMTVLAGTRGLDRKGRDAVLAYLQHGGGVFVTAGADVQGDVVNAILGEAGSVKLAPGRDALVRLAPADSRHPVFRVFGRSLANLGAIRFTHGGRIAAAADGDVIARFSDGSPALVDRSVGKGRVLVFASDLNNQWNDFPLQPFFVPFVYESVKYLAAHRDEPRDTVVGDLPADVPHEPGIIERPGRTPSGSTRRIAVNVDPRESDPTRVTAETFGKAITRMKGAASVQARGRKAEQEETQGLWQYGFALMLVGLVAEGLLGRRMG